MPKIYPFFLLLILFSFYSFAQDFGETSDEVLKMKKFNADPDADAVILFDKSKVRITSYFELEVVRHVRIKILTQAGKDYANIEIPYWHEDDLDIEDAASYSPSGEEHELDSDNIFVEETGKVNKLSFAIPGVEIGSVIEYKYKLFSKYISELEPWYFQNKIYTKFSQLKIDVPRGFNYNKLSKNLFLYDITEKVVDVANRDDFSKQDKEYIFTGRNIPGIKEEPFMDNLEDEYASILFILVSFNKGLTNINFTKNWGDVSDKISGRFYDKIDQGGITEFTVKNIIGFESDNLIKAKKIYDYVRTEIKTSSHNTLFGSEFKSPEDLIKEKSGNSSEKNLLLINLLNRAGLNAKPVLISSRSHGTVIQEFCNPDQFNRLICSLKIGKKTYVLNTVKKSVPFGCLTPQTDVGIGLLLDGDKGKLVGLRPVRLRNKKTVETEGAINEDGSITAASKIKYSGYPAMIERNKCEKEDLKEHVSKMLKNLYDQAELDTFYYANMDSIDKPLELTVKYTLPEYLEETDELAYFPIPLFTGVKENPFKSPGRSYPVDYSYKSTRSEKVKIKIPDTYAVSEVPARKGSAMKNFKYRALFFSGKDYVECNNLISVRNRKIPAKSYPKLKEAYDKMVESSQEQVVLTKKSAAGNVEKTN